MFWNQSIRRQEIKYAYSDANLIPLIHKFFKDFHEKNFTLLKLSWDFENEKIVIAFKSNFDIRRMIADKLRELDSDGPAIRMKRLLEADKKSAEEEIQRYEQMESEDEPDSKDRLRIGDQAIHFKGSKYLVLEMNAKHTENNERLVIYQELSGDKRVFARPYKMFMSKVDKRKYQDSKQKYRFERYDPLEDKEKIEEFNNEIHTQKDAEMTVEFIKDDFKGGYIRKVTMKDSSNMEGATELIVPSLSDTPHDKIIESFDKVYQKDTNSIVMEGALDDICETIINNNSHNEEVIPPQIDPGILAKTMMGGSNLDNERIKYIGKVTENISNISTIRNKQDSTSTINNKPYIKKMQNK